MGDVWCTLGLIAGALFGTFVFVPCFVFAWHIYIAGVSFIPITIRFAGYQYKRARNWCKVNCSFEIRGGKICPVSGWLHELILGHILEVEVPILWDHDDLVGLPGWGLWCEGARCSGTIRVTKPYSVVAPRQKCIWQPSNRRTPPTSFATILPFTVTIMMSMVVRRLLTRYLRPLNVNGIAAIGFFREKYNGMGTYGQINDERAQVDSSMFLYEPHKI
jgi:hypothetical protein